MSIARATASLVALAFATVAGAQQPAAKHDQPAKPAAGAKAAHDSTKHAAAPTKPATAPAAATTPAPAGAPASTAAKPSHDSTKHAPAKPVKK